jgi:chorismate--pyruvate lyase
MHAPGKTNEATWKPYNRLNFNDIPETSLSWLLDPHSLTQRLVASCPGKFQVQVVDEAWARPAPSERRLLAMKPATVARVRQVRLLCDGVPWVFARTAIPYSTLTGPVRRLALLGTRPLGAVLFADKTMRRGGLEIAAIGRGDFLYRQATRGLRNKPSTIWGRRSVFFLSDRPLLVNEIFLPAINGR